MPFVAEEEEEERGGGGGGDDTEQTEGNHPRLTNVAPRNSNDRRGRIGSMTLPYLPLDAAISSHVANCYAGGSHNIKRSVTDILSEAIDLVEDDDLDFEIPLQ